MGSRGLKKGGAEPFIMANSEGQTNETKACWVTHSTGMMQAVGSKPWGFTGECSRLSSCLWDGCIDKKHGSGFSALHQQAMPLPPKMSKHQKTKRYD